MVPVTLWEQHHHMVHCPPTACGCEYVKRMSGLVDHHIDCAHDLALVLNLLVDLDAYLLPSYHGEEESIPKPLLNRVEDVLVEYTNLCPLKHINDWGQCIVPGCPVYEREVAK